MADVTIRPLAAVPEADVALPIKLTVRMSRATMVRGLLGALDRLDQAAARSTTSSEDVAIALFEASNWLDSIRERVPSVGGDMHAEAFRYVRQRTHHGWASAIEYDPSRSTWVWRRTEILPAPDAGFDKLEPLYTRLLAQRPVSDVLQGLRASVAGLAT